MAFVVITVDSAHMDVCAQLWKMQAGMLGQECGFWVFFVNHRFSLSKCIWLKCHLHWPTQEPLKTTLFTTLSAYPRLRSQEQPCQCIDSVILLIVTCTVGFAQRCSSTSTCRLCPAPLHMLATTISAHRIQLFCISLDVYRCSHADQLIDRTLCLTIAEFSFLERYAWHDFCPADN